MRHLVSVLLVALAWAGPGTAAATPPHPAGQDTRIADGTGYVSIARPVAGKAGSDAPWLMVFEQHGDAGIPLYGSRDQGRSWTLLGHVADQGHAGDPRWQLRWQPHLSRLSRDSGDLHAGTLLLAANATASDEHDRLFAQDLQLYTSTDDGRTWHYRSSIVSGGGAPSDPDNKGVWEPNVHVLDDGRMVAYYSSERHKSEGYNQVLAHKVSDDGGRHWGPEVLDVAIPGGVQRPGMATVARLPDRRYAMTYELIDGPDNGKVFIKFSRDGLDWGDPSRTGAAVATASGAWPAACPVLRWFPVGGPQGVLVVLAERAGGGGDEAGHALYWNNALGRGPWWEVPAPVAKQTGNIHAGWTQELLRRDDGSFLHVTSSSTSRAPDDPDANVIVAAASGLDFHRYEAEDAARTGAVQIGDDMASNGRKARIASGAASRLRFRIYVERAGSRVVHVRFADLGLPGVPAFTVNGAAQSDAAVKPEAAGNWKMATLHVPLMAGFNTVDLTGGKHVVDVDYLQLDAGKHVAGDTAGTRPRESGRSGG